MQEELITACFAWSIGMLILKPFIISRVGKGYIGMFREAMSNSVPPQRAMLVTVASTDPSLSIFQTLNTSSSPFGSTPYISASAVGRSQGKSVCLH